MRITWTAIQETYSPDVSAHLARAQALGLNCPHDVFEQLFHDQHDNDSLASIVRLVDWGVVAWEQGALSGVALRQVGVPRAYQRAIDEARAQTTIQGFHDERAEVMTHWEAERSWIRAPILLTGDVLQTALTYELIVGFTRLGNILGVLDLQEIPESALHRVWIGRAA